jgi:DNA-binding CsgD family transcriptional regulator
MVNSAGINLLSKREADVVRLVAESMSNREISQHLELSEHTVKNYLFHIFDKLGVSSRTELVLYAVTQAKEQLPLIEPPESTRRSQEILAEDRAVRTLQNSRGGSLQTSRTGRLMQ